MLLNWNNLSRSFVRVAIFGSMGTSADMVRLVALLKVGRVVWSGGTIGRLVNGLVDTRIQNAETLSGT